MMFHRLTKLPELPISHQPVIRARAPPCTCVCGICKTPSSRVPSWPAGALSGRGQGRIPRWGHPSLLLRWIKDALLETDRDGDRGERARVGGIQRGPRRRGKERPYSRATHKRTSSQRDGHSLSVKGPVSLLLWTNSR